MKACRFIRVPLRVLVGISGVFVCLRSLSGILRDLVFFGVWSGLASEALRVVLRGFVS